MQRNTRAWLSFSLPYVRSVPDSNGCRRFCRPLTKPLIQPTIHIQYGLQYPNATAKVSIFFHSATLSTTFFSSQPKNNASKTTKTPCSRYETHETSSKHKQTNNTRNNHHIRPTTTTQTQTIHHNNPQLLLRAPTNFAASAH